MGRKQKLKEMSLSDLLTEREQTTKIIIKTKNWKAKNDLYKYLARINQEIEERRK